MPAVDNLKKSVTDLETRVNAAVDGFSELKKNIADLQTAISNAPNTDADVQAAADKIDALIGKLNEAIPQAPTAPPQA